MPYYGKTTRYELVGEEREVPISVGVEIESEFEEINFPLWGDFPDGFSGWEAKTDCTLDHGSEIVSPILRGVGGLAEIVGTAEIIEDLSGYMESNCGQHVTVGDPRAQHRRVDWPNRMRNLFRALEEGLYAYTGDYGRMFRGYGAAVKPGNGDGIRGRSGDVMEMRYPPGTLDGTQIAVNVGLCQMLAMLATELPLGRSRELRDEADGLYREYVREETAKYGYHRSTRVVNPKNLDFALAFLRENGWTHEGGGDFRGLPYDPDTTCAVVVHDHYRDYAVTLPDRAQLERHMGRMLNKFRTEADI